MKDKKVVTAVIELVTVALAIYAQDRYQTGSRAEFYLRVNRAARWGAEKLGRLAMASELQYRREVGR